jgi:hypothetical protein
LTRFDWLSRNGTQSHRSKGTKQKAMSEPPDPAATAAVTAAAGTAAAAATAAQEMSYLLLVCLPFVFGC